MRPHPHVMLYWFLNTVFFFFNCRFHDSWCFQKFWQEKEGRFPTKFPTSEWQCIFSEHSLPFWFFFKEKGGSHKRWGFSSFPGTRKGNSCPRAFLQEGSSPILSLSASFWNYNIGAYSLSHSSQAHIHMFSFFFPFLTISAHVINPLFFISIWLLSIIDSLSFP